MSIPPLLVMVLGGAFVASVVPARASARPRAMGRVLYLTGKRAYLDRGERAGLRAGQAIDLLRQGRPAGSCTVEEVDERRATCVGDGLRPGDVFAVGEPAEPVAKTPRPSLPPVLDAAQVERAQRTLARAAFAKVDEGVVRTVLVRPTGVAHAAAGVVAWVAGGGETRERQHLQLSVRDAPVAGPVSAAIEAEAWHWGAGPRREAELFVWEAALTSRSADRDVALALGRIWPWGMPGVSVLDGMQVGVRNEARTIEAGLFGGGVPKLDTTAPETGAWIAGVYITHDGLFGPNSPLRLSREQVRVAVRDTGGTLVGEAELGAQLWVGEWLDLGAEVRASSTPTLDGARGYVRLRPLEDLSLNASARYVGPLRYDDGLAAPADLDLEHLRGDVDLWWSPAPWLAVAVLAGGSRVLERRVTREWVGPEVSLPRLLGRFGGISVGYREELGSPAGRHAFVQALLAPAGRIQVLMRASYFEDRPGEGAVGRDVGLYGHVDAPLGDWLTVRASVLARGEAAASEDGGQPLGAVASLELEARL